MKSLIRNNQVIFQILILAMLIVSTGGCALNPHNVDVAMDEGVPERKVTDFQQAMLDLGLMSQIYGVDRVNVMSQFVTDNTGTSVATRAEIPRDITEMVKSTLNGFGGQITYIPYDPDFILNSAQTGYSGFQKKLIPHVVITGGITEFDRGLETRGKNTDLGLSGGVEGNQTSFDFSNKSKESLASITLDFNMVDFETLSGIPLMQAVNNMKVHKALAENSIAFSVNGNTVGLKGTIKKVQGRHAAVRLLVQVSMIELLGKYLKLPYWRLLGTMPDPVVISSIRRKFYEMNEGERIDEVQKLLILNGYNIHLSGQLDDATKDALDTFARENGLESPSVDEQSYIALYTSVPVSYEVLQKRKLIDDFKRDGGSEGNNITALSGNGLLRMSVNSTTFDIGDQVAITLEVTRPLYVAILNVTSTGEVWRLFPDGNEVGRRLEPGLSYKIPDESASYKLEVTGPSGTDRLIAVGSSRPLPENIWKVKSRDDLTNDLLVSMDTLVETEIHIR